MNATMLRRCALPAVLLLLTACASAPEHLYTLETAEAPPTDLRPDLPMVLVAQVSVPELVDRPQLVVREGKYDVSVREQERWAIPLKEMLPQVIARELSARCPGAAFRAMTDTTIGTNHASLSVVFTNVEINVATGASVVAHWTYRDRATPSTEGVAEGHAAIDSKNGSNDVDGIQRALNVWADSVANQLPVCR